MARDQQTSQSTNANTGNAAASATGAFTQHLQQASSIVRKWPEWKQQLLGRTTAQAPSGAKTSLKG